MKQLSKDHKRVIRSINVIETPTRSLISNDINLSIIKTSNLLDELEKKGFIIKNGKIQAKSGRPSNIYSLHPEKYLSIGVAFKKTTIHITVINGNKEIIKEKIFDFIPNEDPSKLIAEIIDVISSKVESTISECNPLKTTEITMGLCLPGMIDSDNGIWLLGLQIGDVRSINIAELYEKKLSIPVYIEDSPRAVAFLEKTMGDAKTDENFILLYLGIGVGTGIVINRQIYRGRHGVAGEIGHIVHENNNYRCSCGNVGCLETVLTPRGIIRVLNDRLDEGVVSLLREKQAEGLNLEIILDAAKKQDRLTVKTLFEIGTFLGDACSMLIGIFNPEKLIISGEVSILKNYIQESMMQNVKQKLLPEMTKDVIIRFSDYKYNFESFGAALMAMDRNFKNLIDKN